MNLTKLTGNHTCQIIWDRHFKPWTNTNTHAGVSGRCRFSRLRGISLVNGFDGAEIITTAMEENVSNQLGRRQNPSDENTGRSKHVSR